jgi:uncharacterized protein YbbK (DUF523 family)
MTPRPRIGVSACLLGRQVRYDGDHKRDAWVVEELARIADLVPVCPEVEFGLGVPRDPIRLVKGPGGTRLVTPRTGRDLTEEMTAWAEARVRVLDAERLSGFVLKSSSPSCGPQGVKLFTSPDAELPASLEGAGLFARALRAQFPDMPIEDETTLADTARRQSFIERAMVYPTIPRPVPR